MTMTRYGWASARRALMLGFAIGVVALYAVHIEAARAADDAMVRIDNFSFTPEELTVKAGATVTWENEDDIPHSIVLTDKSFHSKPLDTHDKTAFTFTKTGVVAYFCGLHPHMQGKITVVP